MSDAEQETDVLVALGDGRRLAMDGDAGRALLEFDVRPAFCHSGGVAQGGFVTGWIDAAMAHAAIARYGSDVWVASLEVKISFFRPARAGTVVRAEGWIERGGRSTCFLEGRLLDADGEVLAKGSSTARLVAQG